MIGDFNNKETINNFELLPFLVKLLMGFFLVKTLQHF